MFYDCFDQDSEDPLFWEIKDGELLECPNKEKIVVPEKVKVANTKAFMPMNKKIVFPENFEFLTGDYFDATEIEFTGTNFTIDYGNEEEPGVSFVGLKHLTIRDDLDLDKAFGQKTEDDNFKLETLTIKVAEKPHPNFYQNLSKYFDFENIEKITLRNLIDEWNWKYINKLGYFFRKIGIPLEKIWYDYRKFSNYGLESELDENTKSIDLGEIPTYYNTITFSKTLEEIKGKTIWAYNVKFLGNKVVIRDDLTFLDVENITLNDEMDLSKTFCMLSQKIKVPGEMQIYCQAYKNKKFYLNLKNYFDLSTPVCFGFYDIEKTGYSYQEFLNLLKASGFPIDKVNFYVTPVNNRIWQMDHYAFLNYKGSQKELHIPEGIKTIYTYALQDTSIEYLYLPHTIELIGYLPSSLKKLIIADEGNIPPMSLDNDVWIKLTDRTINAENLCEFQFSILQNPWLKKLEIDVYNSLDYLIQIFKGMSNLTIYFDNLMISSPKPLNIIDKIKFKRAIAKYLSKKIEIEFNVEPKLEYQTAEDFKEDLKEKATLNELVDEEIQELLNKIKERKKYLSAESAEKLTLECDNLIKRYYQDLKSSEPSLKDSLENVFSFCKIGPKELKHNLLMALHELVSTFFHQDYEQLITKIREYQKMLETTPHSIIEEPNEKDKVNNIIFIANYFDCKSFKEILRNILENNLKQAQEVLSQDTFLEETIELSLEKTGNVSLKLATDIDDLWQKAVAYQERNQEKKALLEDLNLTSNREFANELKVLKDNISLLDNAKDILDIFNSTLNAYQEYLKKLLNDINLLNDNFEKEQFKSMVRYALSPLEFYVISMERTNIKYTDIENYLQEALKACQNDNIASSNIITTTVMELIEKTKKLNEADKQTIFKKLEDVLNKWLNILILKDYNYIENLRKEAQDIGLNINILELFTIFSIMKDLISIGFVLDSYLVKKEDYQNALLLRTNCEKL